MAQEGIVTLEEQADACLHGAELLAFIDEIHKVFGDDPDPDAVMAWLNNGRLKFNPYHEPAGAVAPTGEPAGGRFADAPKPGEVEETKDPKYLPLVQDKEWFKQTAKLEASDQVLDVTSNPEEGCVGFLTPQGHALNIIEGGGHNLAAIKAGTSLNDILAEGTHRIYASGDFLGIEAQDHLTRQQMTTLQKLARAGSYERFAIESISNKMVNTTYGPAKITPDLVRRLVERAMK
jgi:hypothetical protein